MNQAQKVRAVYAELRHVFGSDQSAADLIRISAIIVKEFYRNDEQSSFEQQQQSIPFYALSLDEAFVDGGWRVLSFEEGQHWMKPYDTTKSQQMKLKKNKWSIGNVQWPRPTEMA